MDASRSDSAKKSGKNAQDLMDWLELLGFGIILLIRWPLTSLWKERVFDYDSPNPLPRSEASYYFLCGLGGLVETVVIATLTAQFFHWLFGDVAPVPFPSPWAVWVLVGTFVVLTSIRVYMYGRNEADGWHW